MGFQLPTSTGFDRRISGCHQPDFLCVFLCWSSCLGFAKLLEIILVNFWSMNPKSGIPSFRGNEEMKVTNESSITMQVSPRLVLIKIALSEVVSSGRWYQKILWPSTCWSYSFTCFTSTFCRKPIFIITQHRQLDILCILIYNRHINLHAYCPHTYICIYIHTHSGCICRSLSWMQLIGTIRIQLMQAPANARRPTAITHGGREMLAKHPRTKNILMENMLWLVFWCSQGSYMASLLYSDHVSSPSMVPGLKLQKIYSNSNQGPSPKNIAMASSNHR